MTEVFKRYCKTTGCPAATLRDAKGLHYETLAICRTLATARRRTAIVVRLVDAHDLPEGICAAATSPADGPRRPRKPPSHLC
jgi:hypothetical protein